MNKTFFDIESVVVIWASEKQGKIWNDLLKNLREFEGEKYWVNPKWWSFEDIKFYKSIDSLPIVPDIAVIVIPAKFVINSLIECWEKWIKKVIIISAGFKEIWNISEEEKIKEVANKYSMRVLWPNCLGYIDAYKKLNLSFWGNNIKSWNIAMISQSWAMAVALTDWANSINIGFSKIISMWNKADIDENDLLEDLVNDEKTDVIVVYLESIENWRRFFEITRKLTKKKPIIMVKWWMSDRGKKAASSHTWALSSENKVLDILFRDAWIHTTSSLENFFLFSEIFSKNKWKKTPESLAIITNAGGPGVMATDHCEFHKIPLEEFSDSDKEILKKNMPEAASMKNPIDVIWDATSLRYNDMLENLSKLDKNIWVMLLVTPQTTTDVENIWNRVIEYEKKHPESFVMTSLMGWESVKYTRKYLRENNVLDYDYPRKWLIAFSRLLEQKKWKNTPLEQESKLFTISKEDKEHLTNILKYEKVLCWVESLSEIFKAFQVPFVQEILVKDISDLKEVWENRGEDKMVAKISSKDIAHKTDCGWVVTRISTFKQAEKAYKTILKNVEKLEPNAKITGITFQDMLPSSKEVFIWMKRDKSFGDILIVGMWGIFVNVYEDVSMKFACVNRKEIMTMLKSLKWYSILAWARWWVAIDFDKLIDVVIKIQSIFNTFKEIKEIDINPVFSNEKWSTIVDAKFYLV